MKKFTPEKEKNDKKQNKTQQNKNTPKKTVQAKNILLLHYCFVTGKYGY